MKPLIYIAGPYTHPDPVANTHAAIVAAEQVEALGCDVVIPHLSLLWHIVRPAPIERWYERDLAVMHRCDALVRLHGPSTGADAEVAAFDGPVFSWPDDHDDLDEWVRDGDPVNVDMPSSRLWQWTTATSPDGTRTFNGVLAWAAPDGTRAHIAVHEEPLDDDARLATLVAEAAEAATVAVFAFASTVLEADPA